MPRYFALLRAINVGGHTVTMVRLRGILEGEGLSHVTTYLASGNVCFRTRSAKPALLERRIGTALHQVLGYEVATFLRTESEMVAAHQHRPFAPDVMAKAQALNVGFLATAPDAAAQQRVEALCNETDILTVRGREIYLVCYRRLNESTVTGKALEKALGQPSTIRNINTIARLAATC